MGYYVEVVIKSRNKDFNLTTFDVYKHKKGHLLPKVLYCFFFRVYFFEKRHIVGYG